MSDSVFEDGDQTMSAVLKWGALTGRCMGYINTPRFYELGVRMYTTWTIVSGPRNNPKLPPPWFVEDVLAIDIDMSAPHKVNLDNFELRTQIEALCTKAEELG